MRKVHPAGTPLPLPVIPRALIKSPTRGSFGEEPPASGGWSQGCGMTRGATVLTEPGGAARVRESFPKNSASVSNQ